MDAKGVAEPGRSGWGRVVLCRKVLPLSSSHQHHLEGKLKCGALGATPEGLHWFGLLWGLAFAFLRSPQVILILLVPRTTHPEPFP